MSLEARLVLVVAILAVSTIAYVWWQRRQGVVRGLEADAALTPADLGASRGQRGTVVQFSTPVCAKCPGTKALLLRVLDDYEDIVHVEVDASERLDLARRLDIMRTPTTLILDARGVPVARMDGPPTVAQAKEALDRLAPLGGYSI